MRRQQQADAEHAILLPSLYDVAGLDEDFFIARIPDQQLVDLADLGHQDDFPVQSLLQGERHGPSTRHAVHEVDREVSVHRGLGHAVRAGIIGARASSASKQQKKMKPQLGHFSIFRSSSAPSAQTGESIDLPAER